MKNTFSPPIKLRGHNIMMLNDLSQHFDFKEFWSQRKSFIDYFCFYPERINKGLQNDFLCLKQWIAIKDNLSIDQKIKGKDIANGDVGDFIFSELEKLNNDKTNHSISDEEILGLTSLLYIIFSPFHQDIDHLKKHWKNEDSIYSNFILYCRIAAPEGIKIADPRKAYLHTTTEELTNSKNIFPLILIQESSYRIFPDRIPSNTTLSLRQICYTGQGACNILSGNRFPFTIYHGESIIGVFDETDECHGILTNKVDNGLISVELDSSSDNIPNCTVKYKEDLKVIIPGATSFVLIDNIIVYTQLSNFNTEFTEVKAIKFDSGGKAQPIEIATSPELYLLNHTIQSALKVYEDAQVIAIIFSTNKDMYQIITTKGIF